MAPLSTAHLRFRVDPRDVGADKAARRLGLTRVEFEAVLDELYARGFPRPDPTTGLFDLKRIEAWMDARHDAQASAGLRDASEAFKMREGTSWRRTKFDT